MKPGNVPTAAVGPLIAELIAERWPHGGGFNVLAEKVGCDEATIEGIVRQECEGCDFDLADKLLCALGRPDAWRGVLADVYLEMPLFERCECPGCTATFVSHPKGRRKRFCSSACRGNAHQQAHGVSSRRRKQGWGGVCKGGHRRTKENTLHEINGRGNTVRRCRDCRRASWRAGAARAVGTRPVLASSQGFSK